MPVYKVKYPTFVFNELLILLFSFVIIEPRKAEETATKLLQFRDLVNKESVDELQSIYVLLVASNHIYCFHYFILLLFDFNFKDIEWREVVERNQAKLQEQQANDERERLLRQAKEAKSQNNLKGRLKR